MQVRRAGEVKFASLRACMPELQQDVKGPPAEMQPQRGGRVSPKTQAHTLAQPSHSLHATIIQMPLSSPLKRSGASVCYRENPHAAQDNISSSYHSCLGCVWYLTSPAATALTAHAISQGGSMAQADQSYRKPRPSRSMEQAPDGSYKVGQSPDATTPSAQLLLPSSAAL